MTLEKVPNFRITVWPGVPLQLPPFTRRASYRLDVSGAALIGSGEAEAVGGRQGEIYLRLYDLDLTDADAILAFANTYGALLGWFVHDQLRGRSHFDGYDPAANTSQVEAVIRADQDVRRCLDPTQPDWPSSFEPLEVTPLTTFAFAAHCLRDLTTAWRLLSKDRTLKAKRARWELQPDTPVTGEWALFLLTHGLQPLLTRFHPFVHSAHPPDGDGDDKARHLNDPRPKAVPLGGLVLEQAAGLGNAQLHEILALELYNHIAGKRFYRRCQNERCGKLFVRQYGRAVHRHSRREGVLYCSASCAQAQAQRAYRRRKKTNALKA